jgi:hypothetical protein
VADTSTIDPRTAVRLGDVVRAAGGAHLDAPVSGSVPSVERGELAVLAGGEAADVERARPVFEHLASRVFHVGPAGAGAIVKLAVNGIVHALNQAVSEALVLAEAAGVAISTPIRPANLTGLGYHPEGENLVKMAPRGENLSATAFLGLFSTGETPEKIHYYLMDAAGREGPETGALDVSSGVGTSVYAPVTGAVTSIRPDPVVQEANVIEIKPDANPDVRVRVSLVLSEGGVGVNDPVTAGRTEMGAVADSAAILEPQLSSYTTDAGNHVTVSVLKVG